MTARIFDIKHFAVHDGPGIRTTVFFKGCPLRCAWCHNPESISRKLELSYFAYKCVNCTRCSEVCEAGVHVFSNGHHSLQRDKCLNCGNCVSACSRGALTLYGRDVTVDKVFSELIEDRDFYGETGGVTLSGGECLMQSDFCREILEKLKAEGIHTAIDTSGFAPKASLDNVIPYTDLFLYDIKAFSEKRHIECTGESNKIILENLLYLDSLGKQIEVRIPFVPDFNSGEIEKMAEFLAPLKSLSGVRVLPYHNFAKSKYASLSMIDTSPENLPTDAEIKKAEDILSSCGLKVLK